MPLNPKKKKKKQKKKKKKKKRFFVCPIYQPYRKTHNFGTDTDDSLETHLKLMKKKKVENVVILSPSSMVEHNQLQRWHPQRGGGRLTALRTDTSGREVEVRDEGE